MYALKKVFDKNIKDLDGVVMMRPTFSPTIYTQQLGRALSVGHNSNPIVFDIVNNVQSCEMVSHFYRELRERALVKFTQTGRKEDEAKIDAFKISDTVRQIQDIFSKIDNCLSLSWDDYYELAVEYYKEHGNLLVPVNYSKNGMNLGYWIIDQRKTMKGQGHRRDLTEKQIEKLDAIGMVWDKFKEQWDETYAIAKADMMIRGGDPNNMRFGDTLSEDQFSGYTFKYCISNPPFGHTQFFLKEALPH